MNDPGVVIFLFTNTFIILPSTSYVGPDNSFEIFPSYFVFISSLEQNSTAIIIQNRETKSAAYAL